MPEILDAITQVTDLLGDLARVDRSTLCDADLVAVLAAEAAAGRLLDASRAFTAGEVAERSRYELGAEGLSMRYSQRKPTDFIEQSTRVSKAEAARLVHIGTAIRGRQSLLGAALAPSRPVLAAAMTCGELGLDAAHAILAGLKQATGGSDATPENLDAAETALVEFAATEVADAVADLGRAWRDALDPDGIEPRYEDILARRGIFVSRERNGIKTYTIKAAPVLAAELDAVFLDSMDPNATPRFMSDEDLARATTVTEDENGDLVEIIVDPRNLEQKRADALEGVLTAGIRATQDRANQDRAARDRPVNLRTIGSVTAVIQLKDLQNGTGFGILEGSDEVIPAAAIQEMVCDTGFFRVLLGRRGEPVFHGPLERYFTQVQRRAMVARDGDRCIAKGCRKRAAESHAHHVILYSEGGPTDVDNGVMLCPAHHHALHQGAFEIKIIDGKPWIRDSIDAFNDNAWQPAGRNRLLVTSLPKSPDSPESHGQLSSAAATEAP
jgi:hypothetical protein